MIISRHNIYTYILKGKNTSLFLKSLWNEYLCTIEQRNSYATCSEMVLEAIEDGKSSSTEVYSSAVGLEKCYVDREGVKPLFYYVCHRLGVSDVLSCMLPPAFATHDWFFASTHLKGDSLASLPLTSLAIASLFFCLSSVCKKVSFMFSSQYFLQMPVMFSDKLEDFLLSYADCLLFFKQGTKKIRSDIMLWTSMFADA